MLLFVLFSIIFIQDLRGIFLKSLIILTIFISSTFVFQFGKSNTVNRIFVKTFSEITNNYFNKKSPGVFIEKNEFLNEVKIFLLIMKVITFLLMIYSNKVLYGALAQKGLDIIAGVLISMLLLEFALHILIIF